MSHRNQSTNIVAGESTPRRCVPGRWLLVLRLLLCVLRYSTVLFKIARAFLTAIGVVALVVAGCALASRYLPITNHPVLFVAAASPYLMLCAPVAMLLLMLSRRWVLAIGALGLTVAAVAVQLPLYFGSHANQIAGVEVRVMSANIYLGMADAHDLVRSARARPTSWPSRNSPREQLTACPRPDSTPPFPTGTSMRAAGALVSACGADIRSRHPAASTATPWPSLAHKYRSPVSR